MNLVKDFKVAQSELLFALQFGAFHMADDGRCSFHYTSLEGLKGILDSKEFWVTEYHYLNDMEEFEYVDNLLREVLKEEFDTSEKYYILLEAVEKYLKESRELCAHPEDSYYVVSFSKDSDNLTLWAEFANYGCNFEANPYTLFDDAQVHMFHSVIYDTERQKELIRTSIRDSFENFFEGLEREFSLKTYLDALNAEQIVYVAKCIVELVVYYGMLMKNKLYANEQEFRVIFSGKNKEIFYKLKENLMVPYIKVPISDKEWLGERLTLAPLNHTEACKHSIKSFLRGKGYCKVDVEFSCIRLRY